MLEGTCKLTGGPRLLDFPSLFGEASQPLATKALHREMIALLGSEVILAANFPPCGLQK